MKKTSKWIVITVLVLAIFLVAIIDNLVKTQNGFGIPALFKYIVIFGLGSAIFSVARNKNDKED